MHRFTPIAGPAKPGDEEGEVAVDTARPKLGQPKRFAVLIHNDDYTTMDFVVEVLMRFFGKSQDEAVQITMKVHHEGKGLAGIYTHQIAETKAAQVGEHARSHGFPLRATIEEASGS